MKWLILLGLLIILVIIIAARYRRQIQMAIYVLRMFRKMRAGKLTRDKLKQRKAQKMFRLFVAANAELGFRKIRL